MVNNFFNVGIKADRTSISGNEVAITTSSSVKSNSIDVVEIKETVTKINRANVAKSGVIVHDETTYTDVSGSKPEAILLTATALTSSYFVILSKATYFSAQTKMKVFSTFSSSKSR